MTKLGKGRSGKGFLVGSGVLAFSQLVFFAPLPKFEDAHLLLYPVGWAGAVGPLSYLAAASALAIRKGHGTFWSWLVCALSVIELALFLRVTCLPQCAAAYGPWDAMFVAYLVGLPVVIGAVAAHCLSGRGAKS